MLKLKWFNLHFLIWNDSVFVLEVVSISLSLYMITFKCSPHQHFFPGTRTALCEGAHEEHSCWEEGRRGGGGDCVQKGSPNGISPQSPLNPLKVFWCAFNNVHTLTPVIHTFKHTLNADATDTLFVLLFVFFSSPFYYFECCFVLPGSTPEWAWFMLDMCLKFASERAACLLQETHQYIRFIHYTFFSLSFFIPLLFL